jgi:hypothetical protein
MTKPISAIVEDVARLSRIRRTHVSWTDELSVAGDALVKAWKHLTLPGANANGAVGETEASLRAFWEEHCAKPFLLPNHAAQLAASGIAPEVIEARGYRTAVSKKDLAALGFGPQQSRVPALVVPVCGLDGVPVTYQARPDEPRKFFDKTKDKEKEIKYETPGKSRVRLDFPPAVPTAAWRTPDIPLWITEGVKKADAAASHKLVCMALMGVWNFRGTNEFGGKTFLSDWDGVALNDRTVYIVFDSDVMTKVEVHKALDALTEFLESKEAIVRYVLLPSADGKKVGLDDYLVAGHTTEELVALAVEKLPPLPSREQAEEQEKANSYERRGNRIYVLSYDSNGVPREKLVSDFSFRFSREILVEDGPALRTVKGETVDGRHFEFDVEASQCADAKTFRSLLENHIGPKARVFTGMEKHLPEAVKQFTNGDIVQVNRFGRTGWRDSGCEEFLLPNRNEVEVSLPKILPYSAVPDADLGRGMTALDNLLTCFDVFTGIPVMAMFVPTLARVAPWAREKYMTFVRGRTGALKTSYSQTLMCLWGPEFLYDDRILRWGEGATRNAIMHLASSASDVPILIDNYKPNTGGGSRDFVALTHAILEGGEKARLTRSSALRNPKEIHAWPYCTGEDIPDTDAATLARSLVVEFAWQRASMNDRLSEAQEKSGDLPAVMSAWLDWLSGEDGRKEAVNLKNHHASLRNHWMRSIRSTAPNAVNVGRTASNLATCHTTWTLLERHPEIGELFIRYRDRFLEELNRCADKMGNLTAESLEASRFLDALQSLLSTRRAICLDIRDTAPLNVEADRMIGWTDEDGNLLILPGIAMAMILKFFNHDYLNRISNPVLYSQLNDLNVLASHDPGRHTKSKKINGKKYDLLHIKFSDQETGLGF